MIAIGLPPVGAFPLLMEASARSGRIRSRWLWPFLPNEDMLRLPNLGLVLR